MTKIKPIFKKELSTLVNILSVVILSTIIGFGFHFAFAWLGPDANPPDNNVTPPLTPSNGVTIDIGTIDTEGIHIIQSGANYPEIHCRRSGTGGTNTLCEFRTGAYFSSSTVYITNDLKARGGISDDGGDLYLNDNVVITGALGSVGSTNKVANLNADMLDGMSSEDFGDATAANQTAILNQVDNDYSACYLAECRDNDQRDGYCGLTTVPWICATCIPPFEQIGTYQAWRGDKGGNGFCLTEIRVCCLRR